jgi:flagellar hook-length control protein FliK
VQRVSRAVGLAHQRGEALQIRLSPPDLGTLRIEIALRDGALVARLETDTGLARNALLDNLPALRERLAEQSIRVERFEVDVRDQSGGRPQERAASFYDQRRRPAEWTDEKHSRDARTTNQDQIAPREAHSWSVDGRLNLIV